jgi:hypothetical protein
MVERWRMFRDRIGDNHRDKSRDSLLSEADAVGA